MPADIYDWSCETSDYLEWSPEDRASVEEFLRACGIDPKDVQISDNPLLVDRHDDGSRVLVVWLSERGEDGHLVRCPHCPACVKQYKVKAEVPADVVLPVVPGTRDWSTTALTVATP